MGFHEKQIINVKKKTLYNFCWYFFMLFWFENLNKINKKIWKKNIDKINTNYN